MFISQLLLYISNLNLLWNVNKDLCKNQKRQFLFTTTTLLVIALSACHNADGVPLKHADCMVKLPFQTFVVFLSHYKKERNAFALCNGLNYHFDIA